MCLLYWFVCFLYLFVRLLFSFICSFVCFTVCCAFGEEAESSSVHCREEECVGLYIPDDQEISRGLRDIPREKPEGHLEAVYVHYLRWQLHKKNQSEPNSSKEGSDRSLTGDASWDLLSMG